MYSILVIDDNDSIRDLLSEFLSGHGFETVCAPDGQSGIELLKQQRFDLFLVDLVMPGMGGLDVLRETKDLRINVPAIIITAFGSIATTVAAMRLGAFDYITKPFNLEELLIIVNRVIDLQKLQKENSTLKKQLKEKFNLLKIIGNSNRMQSLYRMMEKISDTDATVLITGESGTGKELVAKTIHFNSTRVSNPFVPINCGAIPKDLVESELFGHEKGAFTGAISTRVGRFELASGGTIFLDEIGELPFPLQVKLLRVVQEREFERVGGTRTIKMDARILAATNRDLKEDVAAGKFREDLFYRLNVIQLHIPPLRERDDDVLLLLDHFLHEFARKKKKTPLKVSAEASRILHGYHWPGNVRELENAVERIMILNEKGVVEAEDLPEHIQANGGKNCIVLPSASAEIAPGSFPVQALWTESGINLNDTIDMFERSLILHALQQSGGVKNKAAALLGLNRTTLTEKIKKKGLHLPA